MRFLGICPLGGEIPRDLAPGRAKSRGDGRNHGEMGEITGGDGRNP